MKKQEQVIQAMAVHFQLQDSVDSPQHSSHAGNTIPHQIKKSERHRSTNDVVLLATFQMVQSAETKACSPETRE